MAQKAGYLRSCMDKRFLADTRDWFETQTRVLGIPLKRDEYYHEAFAGGALNNPYPDFPDFPTNSPPTPYGADYVYNLAFNNPDPATTIDLVVMGWQVHLNHCGGLGELHDGEILAAFRKLIDAQYFQKKYPNVKRHIFNVQSLPLLKINFSNEGMYQVWCNIDYTDPLGQPRIRWESDSFGKATRSTGIPPGATNIKISAGVTGGGWILSGGNLDPASLNEGTKDFFFTGTPSAPTYTCSGAPLLP
jgi:hypothetical protein